MRDRHPVETPLTRQESIAVAPPMRAASRRWLSGRQSRRLREALLAYAFLIPSILIIGLFGLFPLAFAAYESTLKGLNKVVGTYDSLGNYIKAVDNLAYVLGFWMAAVFAIFAVRGVLGVVQEQREYGSRPWPWLLPGALVAVSAALFARFVFLLLPELLIVPTKLRGQANTRENFMALMKEAWLLPAVQQAFWVSVVVLLVGVGVVVAVNRMVTRRSALPRIYFGQFFSATLLSIGAVILGWFTWDQVTLTYATALEAGEGLDIWSGSRKGRRLGEKQVRFDRNFGCVHPVFHDAAAQVGGELVCKPARSGKGAISIESLTGPAFVQLHVRP
ncbi:sugar ABC transporter permease [Candidatus Microgenomates bacterium]|nr:sugar ABC transporter permease [Candidatus Microgenomates bacterium]